MRKRSMSECLQNKCETNDHGNDFLNVVRPLISDKVKGGHETIVLSDNGQIFNNPTQVSNVFNAWFNIM